VEREAFAVATLVAQMQNGNLDEAPVWSDLGTFDGRAWRGAVDCVIAGLPCQPYSAAGKRRGHDDERAIWPSFMRVVEECEPAVVFLENVAQFVQYFRPVGERLCALGYRIEAGIFSAAEVGAPHRRERFFALAYRENERRKRSGDSWERRARSENDDRGVGDPDLARLEGYGIDGCSADQRFAWPPGPAEHERWAEVPDGLKPAIRRMADESPARMDRLRACGNGVLPLQAAYAFITLARRLALSFD
jgi:DNA (cytosine-5)-methyltransferase 1